MSRLKIHISRLFKSKKINVLLVFVLLALLFSILTKLSKDYTKTISFDIEMIDITAKDSPYSPELSCPNLIK